jgi:hypothetical protein
MEREDPLAGARGYELWTIGEIYRPGVRGFRDGCFLDVGFDVLGVDVPPAAENTPMNIFGRKSVGGA